MRNLVVKLKEVDKEDVGLVGGKGANLGEMIQAGFPVPDGLTVHHVWSLKTVQEEFDTTLKAVVPAGVVTFWLGGDTVSVGPVEVPVIDTLSIAHQNPYVPV